MVSAEKQSSIMSKTLIKNNTIYTKRDITVFHISQKTIVKHSETFAYVNRLDIWMRHELKKKIDLTAFPCLILSSNPKKTAHFLKESSHMTGNGLF